MKAIRISLAIAVVAAMAVTGFAAVSEQYAEFGKGPASFLMTKEEAAKWKTITDDASARAFIDLFWARRDPTPGTIQNEFRDEFDVRVKYADEKFGTAKVRGAMSDRGKTLIILGGPARVKNEQQAAGRDPRAQSPDALTDDSRFNESQLPRGRQIWIYEQDKTKTPLGAKEVSVPFTDPAGKNEWRLERPQGPLFERVSAALIVQPNLTAAPAQTAQAPAPRPAAPPAQAPAPVPVAGVKTEALKAAIAAQKGGTSTLNKNVSISYAELVSPMGDYYVPVQLYVSKAANLTADGADTFFGVVEDAAGNVVHAFEEAAKPVAAGSDFFVDKTLPLTAGKYTAILGLAKAGQPVLVTSAPLDLTVVGKESVGTSKMILSNNIVETAEAAPPKAPFAFGRLKVVPKGDMIFSNKDELSYFVEIHNPGIDPGTNLPKLQTKLDLSGGKLAKPISAPLSDTPALPLTGQPGPGQYAIISSIPLAQLSKPLDPGEYTLKMKIIDTLTKQSYTVEQKFKIR